MARETQKIKRRLSYRRNIFFLGLAVFVLFATAIFSREKDQVLAAPNSTLYFSPATSSINGGENLSLEARINPGSNQVTAVELHATFDPAKLQLSSLTNGPSFSTVLQAPQINNSQGTASIVVGVPASNPPAPVTSDSVVAVFNFTGTGEGVSQVAFTSASMAAAIGEGADVVTTRTPATVTVVGAKKYNNADFAALVLDWLKTVSSSVADVNGDGVVNSADLGIMMSNWDK